MREWFSQRLSIQINGNFNPDTSRDTKPSLPDAVRIPDKVFVEICLEPILPNPKCLLRAF